MDTCWCNLPFHLWMQAVLPHCSIDIRLAFGCHPNKMNVKMYDDINSKMMHKIGSAKSMQLYDQRFSFALPITDHTLYSITYDYRLPKMVVVVTRFDDIKPSQYERSIVSL